MRVKSEAKRQAILAAAAEAFRELGVEATSMSEIAARLGGSKTTLYSYFASKEELVLEILLATGEKHGSAAFDALASCNDVRNGLETFGVEHLRFLTDPDTIAILRLAIAEGGRSDLGRKFHERAFEIFDRKLAAYLRTLIDKGELQNADAQVMAFHLRGLYEAEILYPLLLGATEAASVDELQGMARRAVDAFFRVYGLSEDSARSEVRIKVRRR